MKQTPKQQPESNRGSRVLLLLCLALLFVAGLSRFAVSDKPSPYTHSEGSARFSARVATEHSPITSAAENGKSRASSQITSKRDVSALYRGRGAAPKPPKPTFVQWENRWWPAEILKSENGKTFIHYTGYGPEWDEWVGPERMRSEMPESIVITGGDMIFTGDGNGAINFWWDAKTGEQLETSFQKESLTLETLNDSDEVSGSRLIRLSDLEGTVKESPAPPTKPSIQVEWGGRWWPAHILKSENGHHFIRYQGYGSEWDEWVPPARFQPLNL